MVVQTSDCLTPEQLGVCSGMFVWPCHIPCCHWCRILIREYKHTLNSLSVCVWVCAGSSPMSHLMNRPTRQRSSSGPRGGTCFLFLPASFFPTLSPDFLNVFLTDSAWQYESPAFQELKAEVAEVPAPDNSQDKTGLRLKYS